MDESSGLWPALMKRHHYRQLPALSGGIPAADPTESHDKAPPNERGPTIMRHSGLRARYRQRSASGSIAALFGDSSSRFSCMLVRRSKMTVTLQRYATQLISDRLLANTNDGSVQEATA